MRRIPSVLVLAVVAQIAFIAVYAFGVLDWRNVGDRWLLSINGVMFVADVATFIGLFGAARSAHGLRALGLTIAAVLSIAVLLLLIFNQILARQISRPAWVDDWYHVDHLLSYALPLAIAVSLAIACSRARAASASILLAVATLSHLLPLSASVARLLDNNVASLVAMTIRLGALTALVLLACGARPTAVDPQRAARGLSLAAKSLWLRLIAACVIALALLGGAADIGVFRATMIATSVVTILTLIVLAVGAAVAASSEEPDLPRRPLLVGAACALWTAGALLAQLSSLWAALYSGPRLDAPSVIEAVDAFSIVLPLVGGLAMLLIGLSIDSLGNRRELVELQITSSRTLTWFVVLMIVSILIQCWLLPAATSAGAALVMSLTALVCNVSAFVMMAQLYAAGARALESSGLPAARIA